jgi:hypothetical protein
VTGASQKRQVIIKTIGFRPEVLVRLDAYADRLGISRSSLINQLVRQATGLPVTTDIDRKIEEDQVNG